MASCVASARCLASPAARTAASAASSARVFAKISSSSCCRWSSAAQYMISWRHVDLQEDNDLAADQALKLASDHRNVGERIRTVDLDETEAFGPPTDDGLPTAFLKRAASCDDALSHGRSTKSAARPMPPATRRSSQPSRCSPGPRRSCRPSRSCPGPWCSRPPSFRGRSPSARQRLGQRQGQAPRNLSAVDTRYAPQPCQREFEKWMFKCVC